MSLADPNVHHDVFGWLDSHINYERLGVRAGDANNNDMLHDPTRRLEAMRRAAETLDDPQRHMRSIHVTGTNGKTSTARIAGALIDSMGLRAGVYTSPHLVSLEERIATGGRPISTDDLVETLTLLRTAEEAGILGELSYFEILTLGAFVYFADAPVDVGVIEAGMGGRFDATNIIDGDVAVITNIGLDHQQYLGDDLASIASHKAGIIREGATAIIDGSDREHLALFQQQSPGRMLIAGKDAIADGISVAVGGSVATFRTPYATYDNVFLGLHGAHQVANATKALLAVEALRDAPLGEDIVQEAFATVKSPGRMEVIGRNPLVLLDGAHNEHAAHVLRRGIDQSFTTSSERILVVGMLEPHQPESFFDALGLEDTRLVIACAPNSPRAVEPSRIAEAARALGTPVVVVERVDEALRQAMDAARTDESVIVTGSLYVAGEARSAGMSTVA